jgi:hypothetical protein
VARIDHGSCGRFGIEDIERALGIWPKKRPAATDNPNCSIDWREILDIYNVRDEMNPGALRCRLPKSHTPGRPRAASGAIWGFQAPTGIFFVYSRPTADVTTAA